MIELAGVSLVRGYKNLDDSPPSRYKVSLENGKVIVGVLIHFLMNDYVEVDRQVDIPKHQHRD